MLMSLGLKAFNIAKNLNWMDLKYTLQILTNDLLLKKFQRKIKNFYLLVELK